MTPVILGRVYTTLDVYFGNHYRPSWIIQTHNTNVSNICFRNSAAMSWSTILPFGEPCTTSPKTGVLGEPCPKNSDNNLDNMSTIYRRFRYWIDIRVFDLIEKELQTQVIDRKGVKVLALDSTYIKVHPDGTGAPKKRPQYRVISSGQICLISSKFYWHNNTLFQEFDLPLTQNSPTICVILNKPW